MVVMVSRGTQLGSDGRIQGNVLDTNVWVNNNLAGLNKLVGNRSRDRNGYGEADALGLNALARPVQLPGC